MDRGTREAAGAKKTPGERRRLGGYLFLTGLECILAQNDRMARKEPGGKNAAVENTLHPVYKCNGRKRR